MNKLNSCLLVVLSCCFFTGYIFYEKRNLDLKYQEKSDRMNKKLIAGLVKIIVETEGLKEVDSEYLDDFHVYDDIAIVELEDSQGGGRYIYINNDGDVGILGDEKILAADLVNCKLVWGKTVRESLIRDPPQKNKPLAK